MQITVVTNVSSPVPEKEIIAATKAAFRLGGQPQAQAEVWLVGDARMRKLNRQYRHKDRVTNVLAFGGRQKARQRAIPFFAPGIKDYVGEIVICVPSVRREAWELKVSVRQHLQMLLVHGALHLLGFDHHRRVDEKHMAALEQKVCSKIF